MTGNMKGILLLLIAFIVGIVCAITAVTLIPNTIVKSSNIGITIPADTLDYSQTRALHIDIASAIISLDKNNNTLQTYLNVFNGKDSLNVKPVDQSKYEELSAIITEQKLYLNTDIYQYNKTMNDTRYKYIYVDVPLPAYYEYR